MQFPPLAFSDLKLVDPASLELGSLYMSEDHIGLVCEWPNRERDSGVFSWIPLSGDDAFRARISERSELHALVFEIPREHVRVVPTDLSPVLKRRSLSRGLVGASRHGGLLSAYRSDGHDRFEEMYSWASGKRVPYDQNSAHETLWAHSWKLVLVNGAGAVIATLLDVVPAA